MCQTTIKPVTKSTRKKHKMKKFTTDRYIHISENEESGRLGRFRFINQASPIL